MSLKWNSDREKYLADPEVAEYYQELDAEFEATKQVAREKRMRTYMHVWQSENCGYDPEGYLRGQIDGKWVSYDYAYSTNSEEKPNAYKNLTNLHYLGFLDENSPIDTTYKTYHFD